MITPTFFKELKLKSGFFYFLFLFFANPREQCLNVLSQNSVIFHLYYASNYFYPLALYATSKEFYEILRSEIS